MPYLLWRTGILCHRVSCGSGHPRTVQGCRTYYGVQGYSAIECPVVGDIPGQSRDAVLTMAYRDTRVSYGGGGGGDIPGQSRDAILTMAYRDTLP